jgi:hypothetical protein
MADSTAVRAASMALRDLLKLSIPAATADFSLRSPKQIGSKEKLVSLWLYRVGRNAERLNDPPERIAPDRLAGPPIPLDLFYLVTPMADEPETAQIVLGAVVQALSGHPTLRGTDLSAPFRPGVDELRVTYEPMSLEDHVRIWTALQATYRLSVTYRLEIVRIDSPAEPLQVPPVEQRHLDAGAAAVGA